MKKLFIISLIFSLQILPAFSSYHVFSEKRYFGLKNDLQEVIIPAIYEKMIKLGDNAYIIRKKSKYGIIDNSGKILVQPKYSHADRFFDRYVKLGNTNKYGVFNEYGETLLPPVYKSIELLSSNLLLTFKDYKYGITDFNGNIILKNMFDDIYMPDAKTLRIQYNGKWFEVKQLSNDRFTLPSDINTIITNKNYNVNIYNIESTVGYSAITFTDYLIKMFSSVSPAHEETIDELLLSHGADTVSILIKMSWLPKYPWTFLQKYYSELRTPNNGPLSSLKEKLKTN